jgi:hypothetical protein
MPAVPRESRPRPSHWAAPSAGAQASPFIPRPNNGLKQHHCTKTQARHKSRRLLRRGNSADALALLAAFPGEHRETKRAIRDIFHTKASHSPAWFTLPRLRRQLLAAEPSRGHLCHSAWIRSLVSGHWPGSGHAARHQSVVRIFNLYLRYPGRRALLPSASQISF